MLLQAVGEVRLADRVKPWRRLATPAEVTPGRDRNGLGYPIALLSPSARKGNFRHYPTKCQNQDLYQHRWNRAPPASAYAGAYAFLGVLPTLVEDLLDVVGRPYHGVHHVVPDRVP
jgi:hypothetical protein